MFEDILWQMRERIRARHYVMTLHGEEEMDDDGLAIDDVEQAVLLGSILERQKDPETGESKYLVRGCTVSEDDIIVVAKLSPTGTLVIITVFRE